MKLLIRNNLPPASQRGFIILAMLLILVIGGSTLALGALSNRQSVYLTQQAELHRQMELAKQALLAYAANSATLFGNLRGPGYLPCPDTSAPDPDAIDVVTDGTTTLCSVTRGRLPEAVDVGTTRFFLNDFYSKTDQQFWYAVGARYTNTSTSTSSTTRQSYRRTSVVSTDTVAYNVQLELDDSTSPRYIAFIIAPGEALGSQTRESAADITTYTNYLDGLNGDSATDYYTSDATDPDNFNDQILGITVDEYIKAIGPVIGRYIKRELDEAYPTDYPTSGTYDSEFPNSAPSSSNQNNFRNIFNYNSAYSADIPIWLKRNSSTYPNSNGELWPNYIYYTDEETAGATTDTDKDISRFIFRGCIGLIFTIDRTAGVSHSGNSC